MIWDALFLRAAGNCRVPQNRNPIEIRKVRLEGAIADTAILPSMCVLTEAASASMYEKWDLLLKILAGVALIPTLFFTWWTHRQRSTFDMIDGLYSLCHILQNHMLQEWRLSHLFCIGVDIYETTKREIAAATVQDEDARRRLAVMERQFAVHIFVIYEQVYFQWMNSSRIERARRVFLSEMLSYFTDRLLRNPRLVAYFASNPTGEKLHIEATAAENLHRCYQSQVLQADMSGPFDVKLIASSALRFTLDSTAASH